MASELMAFLKAVVSAVVYVVVDTLGMQNKANGLAISTFQEVILMDSSL